MNVTPPLLSPPHTRTRMQIGTPVRIRGVQVGQVLAVKPSLERVDVLVEVRARGGDVCVCVWVGSVGEGGWRRGLVEVRAWWGLLS